MFSDWKGEKATVALVDAAQAVVDKLAASKPHFTESHAATAHFWAASYLSDGLDLYTLAQWTPSALARFIAGAQAKIASLRKQRDYDSSDGLAVWLHTARAIAEPRVAPAVRDIWRQLSEAGPNADAMADDLLTDAGLPLAKHRRIPSGFGTAG